MRRHLSLLCLIALAAAGWLMWTHLKTTDAVSKTSEVKSGHGSPPQAVRPRAAAALTELVAAKMEAPPDVAPPLRPVEELLRGARTVQTAVSKPDAQGRYTRQQVVEAKFKFPFLRIEEEWSRDPVTGEERMQDQKVMVADHFLVTLREGDTESEMQRALEPLGARVRRHLPNSRIYLVEIGGTNLEVYDAKLAEYRLKVPQMKIVEPDYLVFATGLPNDPSFSLLWGLNNTGQTGGTSDVDVDAPEAWDATQGSSSVVVGVVDTGIDHTHPDLAANIWINPGETPNNGIDDDGNGFIDDTRGWDFVSEDKDPSDDQYHGTHCAGTIGAVGNNGIGIAGVCHTVRLMALKFLSSSGSGTTSDAIQAVNYATANHATLTSNSWGGGGYSQILKDAIDAAGTAGVLFIASAGNNGRDTDLSPSYPASYDSANIISVAASDHRDELASFTNYGAATVDLAAPGVSVYSASPGSSYRYLSGTSMACPHVAGACALIKSAIPEMGWPELKAAILNNVDAVAAMDGKVGAKGRLNVARSLIQSLGPYVGVSSMQPSDNGLLGSMGNNDGLLNPGEDIAVTVNLKNVGTELAGQTQSTLSVISAGGKVTVLQGVKAWGDLEPGAAVNNGGAPFLIRIAPGTVTPHAFTLVLTTTATGGHTWTAQAQLTAYTSSVISGRVMAATGGAGIAGATVNYSGTATGSVLTGADGNYEIKLTDGFYQLRAAAPAYNPSAALPVTVPPSAQGLNFALGRSRLQVTPGALSSTQNEDTVVTKILTLTNEGDAPLNFSVSGLAEGASAAVALTKPPPVVSVLETADPPPAAPTSAGSKVATVAALPFAEGFESGSLSDWITDSGTGTREIVSTTAAVGARSFHYKSQGSNAHYNGIHRDFAAGATPASVSFWVRSGSTTTHDSYFVLTDPTYGATPIWFYANGYGRFYVNTDVGGDDTFNYQANVWYRVEFRDIDWKAKDFDYYVNGTLMKANIPFRNEPLVDEISALWLYNYSAGSEAWWDDIRLSQSIADWLTQTPGGGTLAPGQSLDLTVTFNAMDKLPGEYLGQIEISSDDLANPVVSVPVTMTVQMPPNTPPVAEAQTVVLDEDTRAVITLTGSDAEGQALTAEIQTLPVVGSLFQTSDGTSLTQVITAVPATVSHAGKKVIYVPPPNAHGEPYANFKFIMRDKRSQSGQAAVTLNVTSVNDLPVALNDFGSGLPGEDILSIPVLANDADVDGPALVIESFTQPQKGTVTNNGNGTLRFAPHASFLSGEDSFAYTVSDGAGGSATATVHVAVGLLAAGPWAMMGRDAAHTGHYPGWLGAETFSQAWTVQVAQQPLHQVVIGEGKVFAAPDIIPGKETQISAVDLMYGAVAWKKVFPQANTLTGPAYHNGSVYLQRSNGSGDSQLFAVAAADGGTRWSTAFATQGEKYKSPTVTDTSVFTPGGNSGGLLGYNRTTGAQAFFTSLSAMAQWTPALDGEFVYTCTGGTFRQHHAATGATLWSLNVGSGNALTPVIGAGSGFIIPNGTSPHHLVCVNLATKSVRWRVQTGFAGTPAVAGSFVYAYDAAGNVSAFNVADGSLARSYVTGLGAGAGLGGLSGNQPIVTNDVLIAASATTTVIHSLSTGAKLQTINAGGWPSLSNGYLLLAGTDGVLRSYTLMGNNIAPLAQNQTVTCVEDQTVTVTLPGTDANGDPLSALITALPAKGVLYQTTDGVQIGAPITLLPAIVSNPQRMVIYRPEADGFGTAYATFKFRTTDGRASSAEATTTINVASVNDAPVAVDDAVYLRAGTLLDGYVPTGNDTDADGESLVVFATTAPAKGELTKNADGSLRYVPQEGFIEGTDSFEYTLRDGAGLTSSATVTLLVSEAYGREWTQFGNGADHPGRYPVLLGTQAWVQRWEYSYPAAINAAAVAAGRVYVTPAGGVGSAAYVSALDAATGGELWRAQMPNGRANPPSYHGETVFTQRCNTSSDSQLWALNADDGSLKWSNSHSMQSGRYLSPAVTDLGVCINVGGSPGGVRGFDFQSGAQRFFSNLTAVEECTPAIHEGKVYSFMNGVFRNHHAVAGSVLWSVDLTWGGGTMQRTICCAGGKAYVTNDTSGGAELICLDLQSRSVLWRVKGSYSGTPAFSNGLVYACSGGYVKAHNAATGQWLADYYSGSTAALNGAPAVSHDLLFAASATRTYIFNLATRAVLQTMNVGSQIAIADDVLYLSCSDNKVRAYGRSVPGNQAPVALGAQVTIPEEAETVITLGGTDGNGDALRFVVQTLPAQGTLYQTADGVTKGAAITRAPAHVVDNAGRVVYQPPKDVYGGGLGYFTFTANDRVSTSVAAMVTINVTSVNDPPVAVPDVVAVFPGVPLRGIRPELNDRDPDDTLLSVITFSQGASGQVSMADDGSLTYVPNAGFSGTDSFGYTVLDRAGAESSATVRVIVSATAGRLWPTFGAGPDHTGYQPVFLGSSTLAQRWQAYLGSTNSQAAVADGRVYVSKTSSNALFALDGASGTRVWHSALGSSSSPNPPTWYNDSLYVQSGTSSNARLYSFDAATGATRWSTAYGELTGEYLAPVADDSGVYFSGVYYGGMYGFNLAGTQRFFRTLASSDGWTPSLYDGGLYSFVGGVFRSHDKAAGTVLWSLDFGWAGASAMNRTTAFADGRVFLVNESVTVPAGEQELICVNLGAKSVAWKVQGKFSGTPAVAHGAVYAIANGTAIKAYDALTGDYLGVYSVPGDVLLATQPIVTNDSIIACSSTRTYIFNLASRSLRQTILVGSYASLAGKVLYITSSNGYVRAFGLTGADNQAPKALPVAVTTQEDIGVEVSFQGTDDDGDPLRYLITALPAAGTLIQIGDGAIASGPITTVPAPVSNHAKVIYLPPADQSGAPLTTFAYIASDNAASSDPAVVTVTVQPVNDPPAARADVRLAEPGQVLSPLNETSNDSDPEGDSFTVTSFTQPALGKVERNDDGTLRYLAPTQVATGTAVFTYTVTDYSGAGATGTVTVTIAPRQKDAWPTFGNGPAHTGYSGGKLARGSLVPWWSHAIPGYSYTLQPVAAADGSIFVTFRQSDASRVVALSVDSGAQLWSRKLPKAYSLSPPSWHAGRVYVQRCNHDVDTQLIALRGDTGETVWTAPHGAQWDLFMAPAVTDLGVFVNGGSSGVLMGFGPDGASLFSEPKPALKKWAPAFVDSELYAFVQGDFVKHNPLTGAPLWTRSLGWGGSGSFMERTAALADRRAFLINDSPTAPVGDEDLVSINLDSSAVVWSVNGQFSGTPAVHGGLVFAISGDTVQARSVTTGGLIATYETPVGTELAGQPLLTDDLLVATSYNRTFIFDRSGGTLLQTLEMGGSAALVGDALILASQEQGTVSAWGLEPELSFSPTGGYFSGVVPVTITAKDAPATIHYTTDGSAPHLGSASTPSGGTISIAHSGILRAIAVKGSAVSRIHQAAFHVAGPEIGVERSAVMDLASGGSVDFNQVGTGAAKSLTFTLKNHGAEPLHLSGPAPAYVTTSGSADFSVTQQPSTPVAAAGSTAFTVTFAPSGLGSRTAVLSIPSNDHDENPFTLNLIGEGEFAGEIAFAQAAYRVDSAAASVDVTITRSGRLPCEVAIRTENGTSSAVPPFVPALAGTDYVALAPGAKVSFAEGETSKTLSLTLPPHPERARNERFFVRLGSPTGGAALGAITTATVEIVAGEITKPTLTITAPAANARVSARWPWQVTGTAGDVNGIARVEVALNGAAAVLATLAATQSATAVPFSLPIEPQPGLNMIDVTAYDLGGNSTTVTRSFTFTRRYLLSLTRNAAPLPIASAGTVALVAAPSAAASPLTPTGANSSPQIAAIEPGVVVKITATAKTNAVFDQWSGLPLDAEILGNVATFTMPAADVAVTADFIPTPFAAPPGRANTFQGLLRAADGTAASNATEGFLTGVLTNSGGFTGKLLVDGVSQPIKATFMGNGSALFTVGAAKQTSLAFGGRTLSLTFDIENGRISATLANGVLNSLGTAGRPLYSAAAKVPASLLNSATQGFYTVRLPVRNETPAPCPGGDGFATLSVSHAGTIAVTGCLADGTVITASSALMAADQAPLFVPLTTPGSTTVKGGSLSGTLAFDPAQAGSDVTGPGLLWFRPAAMGSKVLLYTSGWPQGVHIDAVGALYQKSMTVQTALGLGFANAASGNASLHFSAGKLTADILKTKFNITGNTVAKLVPVDGTYTLTLAPATGAFSGSFTPNWDGPSATKPAFKGIILQKGASKGGSGFFISNAKNDPAPESGRVELEAP